MWQWSAVIAMACFVGYQLIMRELSRSAAPSVLLLFVFAFGGAYYLGHVLATQVPIAVPGRTIAWLAVVAVLSYVGNYFQLRAVSAAPNPGYAVAIISLQAVGVMLISFVFLGGTLTWMKAGGVLLCCAGVALLVL